MYGCIYRDGKYSVCIFSYLDTSVLIRKEEYLSAAGIDASGQLLNLTGRYVRAFSDDPGQGFHGYYEEKSLTELSHLTKEQWQTQIEGRACFAEERLNITPYCSFSN